MKYLWIGVCLSENQRRFILDGGGKILSANVSQDALLAGLEKNGVVFDSINAHRFPDFPQFKYKVIPEERWSRNGVSRDVGVGYKNKKYISHLYKTKALRREARAWATENANNDVTVIVYSMHSPFMACAAEVKKLIPSAKINVIVPDLPQYMDLHMSKIKRMLKAVDWIRIKKLMRSVDKYILYSKHMAKFLKLNDGDWTVMEGSFDPGFVAPAEKKSPPQTISIMYSGVLNTSFGIPQLLDAFALIDDERFELWFTGGGNAVDLINERAAKDPRIHNYGYLPSRNDLLIKQQQATMLISPRRPDKEASSYCFPSKLFEYMASGNPVLSCRLGGIPDEYFDYLIEMKSTCPEDIRDAIMRVASMTEEERHAIGEGGKKFVLENKNNVKQAELMLSFIGG